jgi:hypothetical protein
MGTVLQLGNLLVAEEVETSFCGRWTFKVVGYSSMIYYHNRVYARGEKASPEPHAEDSQCEDKSDTSGCRRYRLQNSTSSPISVLIVLVARS